MNKNAKLAKVVALGSKRYIVQYGILGWGLTTAALFTAWTFYSKTVVRPMDIIVPFIVFPIAGIAWGALMWPILKKRHDAVPTEPTK